ncbi:outer membrane beta-barrel family protein [Pedobacter endophyticus]|uniref:TonB-dependent receptor n=1 Tax=Pedobacter endophyticus TaxID=2789740 RepID=A0A7U3Q5P4_9SPHI|nr:outer membrane beta-barrel family protein [Pedobacter endophyticus]QPH38257.1 TonB-dependent receptor [Pedobacter endophyticus]
MLLPILSKPFLIISFILLCWFGNIRGQYSITGEVLDNKNLPVAYTKISVVRLSDSSTVASSMTTLDGKYKLQVNNMGEYFVSLISWSYKNSRVPVSIRELNTIIPAIHLEPSEVNLKEVSIKANRPLYERQIDRVAVNIGNQNTLVSGSVLEVLEKLPGVKVDRQTSSLSLNGKEEVGIMLEGKIVNIPLSSLIQMLNTMEAGNIKQIELITNPPAKYEAGNAGGLINILLNKRTTDGTNGAYTTALGFGDFDKQRLAVNWNTRKKALNFFGDLSYNRDRSYRRFENYKTITTNASNYSSAIVSSRFPTSANYSGRLGLDFSLNDKTTLGSSIYGLLNTWDQHVKSRGNIYYRPDSIVNLGIFNSENSKKTLFTGNVNLAYKIDKKSNLDVDLDYLYFYNKNPNFYENTYADAANKEILKDVFTSEKRTPVNIWAARTDYGVQVNKNMKLEAGYKVTLTSLDNLVSVARLLGQEYVPDPAMSGRSHLNEIIHAFYGSAKWNINKNTTMNVGLRYENSDTHLTIIEQKQVVNRNLGRVFPTLFLSRTLNANSTLLLSYGKRISRPTYNDLAPFILFLDPTTLYNGNISLKPSLSDVYTLTYNFKRYSITTEFINTIDPIFRFQPVLSEDNRQVFMPINLKNNKIYSALLYIPVRLSDWWQIDNSLQGVLQSTQLLSRGRLSDSYYRIKSTQNFMLSKQYYIQVFGSYQSARLTGASRTSPSNKIDVSIDKKWLASNDRLQLSISNILSDRYHVTSINEGNPNFSALTDYRYESRIVRLTYTHTFGNIKLEVQRKINKAIDEIEERVIK